MKTLKKIILVLGALYIVFCGAMYFLQDKLIFLPDRLPETHAFRMGEEVEIEVEKGISLNCLWMKEPNARGVILYLHGNRGSNRRCLHQAQNMAGHNYDIFMPDYRGYGKSDGYVEDEEQLFADVQQVYDYLKQHYDESQIVVAGYSLGSGLASWLAAHNQPMQLILIAPYLSMIDLKNRRVPIVPNFLLKYHLNSKQYLAEVDCPVTLFHGTRDEVIPYESSTQLQALQPGLIELVTLQNEGHRGAIFNQLFRRRVGELLN